MELHSDITATGTVTFTVIDNILGNIFKSWSVNNLIVTVGKNYIASRMASNSATVVSHMALGGGTTSPIASNTTLGSEITRVALTSLNASGNQITAIGTFGSGSSGTISEAGIFNASSSGTMLCRTTFTPFVKTSGQTIIVTWTITIA